MEIYDRDRSLILFEDSKLELSFNQNIVGLWFFVCFSSKTEIQFHFKRLAQCWKVILIKGGLTPCVKPLWFVLEIQVEQFEFEEPRGVIVNLDMTEAIREKFW